MLFSKPSRIMVVGASLLVGSCTTMTGTPSPPPQPGPTTAVAIANSTSGAYGLGGTRFLSRSTKTLPTQYGPEYMVLSPGFHSLEVECDPGRGPLAVTNKIVRSKFEPNLVYCFKAIDEGNACSIEIVESSSVQLAIQKCSASRYLMKK